MIPLRKYKELEIDFESPANEIVQKFSKYADMKIENTVVCMLDRPRHHELINKVRQTGARIKLIPDGDVSAVIATSFEGSGVDMYMGIGGSPEGVLAAAALRCIGGKIYSKLVFSDENEKVELENKIVLDVLEFSGNFSQGTIRRSILDCIKQSLPGHWPSLPPPLSSSSSL